MRLTVATLCDAATTREGLLHILGAGPTTVSVPLFPAALSLALALQFYATPDDLTVAHQTEVALRFQGGDESAIVDDVVAKIGFVFGPGQPEADLDPLIREYSVPFVVPIGAAVLPRPGRYALDVSLDGVSLVNLPLVASQRIVG